MIKPIDPTTNIAGLNNLRVGDFWKWGYSDMLNSGNRGTFAEFLVRAAIGELKLGSTYLERGSSVDIDY